MKWLLFIIVFLQTQNFAFAADLNKIEKAKGNTKVKAVLCNNLPDGDCKITARFEDMQGCEFYKRYYTAPCDRKSEPGFAICDLRSINSGNGDLYDLYCIPE